MTWTIARLTLQSLLGRRRSLLLLLLSLFLIALAVAFQALSDGNAEGGRIILTGFGLGTIVPLLALIAGTGSIGPEIDDGSIVYLLAKPIGRLRIIAVKLGVAICVTAVFGAVAVLIAGLIIGPSKLAVALAVTALVAGTAYSALFLMLAVVTRNSVIVGLLYALIWETTIGGVVPGAKTLSIRQWSLSIGEALLGSDAARLEVESPVRLAIAVTLLVVTFATFAFIAVQRLRSVRLSTDE